MGDAGDAVDNATYTPSGGSATTLYQIQPTYDQLGNVIENVTTLPQGVDTQVFCYDDLSRLTWAGSSGTPTCAGAPTPSDTGSLAGTGGAEYSASYAYDTLNRLTSSPLGGYTYGDTAHPDAATAIGSAWTASYDAAGNMTCRAASSATTCAGSSPTGAQLSYDNQGQLAAWQNTPTSPTQSASYLYDGEGHRVEQVATTSGTTTTTSYIGSLEEVTTSGSTTTTTAYYGSLALSVNGALRYTLSDGPGSVSESVNTSDGSVTATQLYAPYGGVRSQSGTLPTDHGFTGQVSDAATSGLDYYGARYYDPVAGQFTSADTTLAGGLNRYAYVGGSPESRTDPSGHRYTCLGFVGCGGGGNSSGSGGCGAACGGGGAGGSLGSLPKGCNYGYKCQIDSIFKNPKTRLVLEFIANSGSKIGIELLQFLLFVGAKIGGDKYITWLSGKKISRQVGHPSGGGTDAWTGDIELANELLKDHTTLNDAASSLIHEAAESYFIIERGIHWGGMGSQRGDYVAEWFAGEFESQAYQNDPEYRNYALDNSIGNGPGHYKAYGYTFEQWTESYDFKSSSFSKEFPIPEEYWGPIRGPYGFSGTSWVGFYNIGDLNRKEWDLAGY